MPPRSLPLTRATQSTLIEPYWPKTIEDYERLLRLHITPALGGVKLTDLSPVMVNDWQGRMGRRRVTEYARMMLRAALGDAVRLGIVGVNVVDRVRPPKVARRRVVPFLMEELPPLFAAADTTRMGPLVRFLVWSGLRRGEALALRWDDVSEGVVHVHRNLVPVQGGVCEREQTKTAAGHRHVAIPQVGLDALRAQRAQVAQDRLRAGGEYEDEGRVFATGLGRALDPHNVSRDFAGLRKRAGVRPLPLHSLRHTSVSLQLAAGVPLEVISKRIGHRHYSYSVTMDVYGHLLPESDAAAAGAMDAWLARVAAH